MFSDTKCVINKPYYQTTVNIRVHYITCIIRDMLNIMINVLHGEIYLAEYHNVIVNV